MAYIATEKIDEIRKAADIVNVISNYVPLTQRGKNYFGVCPFHDDNNPSMSVSKEKQIYTCFSCGATGNVFKFIMDYEHVSFPEAVKTVASLVGISVDIGTIVQHNNNQLYNIYETSLKFYQNNLQTKAGKIALNYLSKRNIKEDIIKEFKIGLSLSNNKILSQILSKQYNIDDILKSGLVNNNYGLSDLYTNRIMFPLCNLEGQVVGYSGRIYNTDDQSKYINTKETEIFNKGELLYNFHRAKDTARIKNQIIVMEGFMDVIRAYTVGIKNVVATMGTAVTKNQAKLIKRMAKEVVLCFDGDKAGEKATISCADELLKIGVTPKVIRLDENLDPDEYITKYGVDKFNEKLNYPLNILDFKLNILKSNQDLTNSIEKANYVNSALKEINKIDDDVLKQITIQKLAKESDLTEEFIKSKVTKKPIVEMKKSKIHYSKYQKAELALLYYMLKNAEVIQIYNKKIGYMPTEKYRLLAREIYLYYRKYQNIDISQLIDFIRDDELLIKTIGEVETLNLKEKYTLEEIDDYIKAINEYNVNTEINRLTTEIKQQSDSHKKVALAKKIVELKVEGEYKDV